MFLLNVVSLPLLCVMLWTVYYTEHKQKQKMKTWERATCCVCMNTTYAFVDVHPLQLGLSVFR